MSRDNAIILDILKAAKLAIEFLGNANQNEFNRDSKTQSAILHQLLLIGEAVKRLSEKFRDQYHSVPWKKIAGMRDVLIHQYDDVDLDEVWRTVRNELPGLIAQLDPLVKRLS